MNATAKATDVDPDMVNPGTFDANLTERISQFEVGGGHGVWSWVFRTKVPGGWLYHVSSIPKDAEVTTVTTTFVPEPSLDI